MARFGVIFAAWQSEDLLDESLSPWVAARQARLGGHEYVICAVSVPFVGFPQPEVLDGTVSSLQRALGSGDIDQLVTSPIPLTEVAARGEALRWLVTAGCTVLVQADSDEAYRESDILGVARWVEANPFSVWARVSLRNAVFTRDQYLTEPFTPPRVHRVRVGSYRAHSFWDDNNVLYGGTITRDLKRDVDAFASATIPTALCHPRHYSWLSDTRSRDKVAYQRRRWGHCSYQWDETTQTLAFDPTYYSRRGLPLPEVAIDPPKIAPESG